MKLTVQKRIERKLSPNVNLQKKALGMKQSFDEVAKLLKIDKGSNKS